MRKHRFKMLKLFFKLMLLFQIYSQHKFTVEAASNSFPKSCDEYEVGDGKCENYQMNEKDTGDHHVLDRPKRPFRLLPVNNSLYVFV